MLSNNLSFHSPVTIQADEHFTDDGQVVYGNFTDDGQEDQGEEQPVEEIKEKRPADGVEDPAGEVEVEEETPSMKMCAGWVDWLPLLHSKN